METAPVEIREVTSGGDLSRFTKLPWTIYAGDPQWVPPLLTEVREFVNRKRHPFYLYGDATMFLALRSGRPAGRILVSDDPHYNEFHHENLGFFGKFEFDERPRGGARGYWMRPADGCANAGGPVSAVRSTTP